MRCEEHAHQAALFRWAELEGRYQQDLQLMFAIPNGARTAGISVAVKLKREGLKKGVPDICLPVPRGAYHGLFIEMKAAKGRATLEQMDWIGRLIRQGYYAAVCKGFDEARATIENYLEL